MVTSMSRSIIDEVREDVLKVRKYVCVRYPWFFSIIAKCRIVIREGVGTAATDGRAIYVDPNFWKGLSYEDRVFTLMHEAMHIALKHVDKSRSKKYRGTWNIATDAVINEFLMKCGVRCSTYMRSTLVTGESIETITRGEVRAEEVPKLSADELYWRLLKYVREEKSSEFMTSNEGESSEEESESESGGSGEEGEESSSEGREGKEGGEGGAFGKGGLKGGGEESVVEPLAGGELSPEDVFSAFEFAKGIGREDLGKVISIDKVLGSRVNWRKILRIELQSIFTEKVISTWRRVHRKLPDIVPGHVRKGRGDVREVWVLVDVSGSVVLEGKVLRQFFSEVVDIAKHFKATLHVVTWDTAVRDHVVANSVNDVLNALSTVHGGGGTEPEEALSYTLSKIHGIGGRARRVLILMSDGLFRETTTLNNLVEKCSTYFSKCIYVYTIEEHSTLFKKWVRIFLTP